ncbi:hypothetical protein FCM35_KLT17494 [Carex littledalei]|uniref:Uncharacterized protein n=1 Tax=Carex littledalei TaxID=544730 RepID=A0A833RC58_9POAL|nr:hypothetical protein FCM35_KLT17494 [Carex littledalei]
MNLGSGDRRRGDEPRYRRSEARRRTSEPAELHGPFGEVILPVHLPKACRTAAQVNMLKEKDKSFGAIKFVDISSKDYSPQENQGLEYETVAVIANAIYGVWAKYRLQLQDGCSTDKECKL